MKSVLSAQSEQLNSEINNLKRRAFQSWDDDYLKRIKAQRIGCGTFTLRKAKHQRVIKQLLDEYFFKLAKRYGRHFIVMFGVEPDGTQLRKHIQADIFILPNESQHKPGDLDLWVYEGLWKHGQIEIEKHRGGRSLAYAVAKHDGDSDILKVYCPKTGNCKKTKGNRLYCEYRRNPKLFIL